MDAHNCHCNDEFRRDVSGSLTNRQRNAWRNAFATLASPMIRLHRLRNIRTQMLREALGDLDDCDKRGDDA